MDAKALIVIMLVSLVVIVSAVIALWMRGKRRGSELNERLGSYNMPTQPSPARERQENPAEQKKEAEPPRGQPTYGSVPQPPSFAPPPPPPVGFGGLPSAPPASIPSPRPQAPITPPAPAPSAPPPQAPGAMPLPFSQPIQQEREEAPLDDAIVMPKPAAPITRPDPAPADDKPRMDEEEETETEATDALRGGGGWEEDSATLAEPIPALPLLDEMPAEELADWMKAAASTEAADTEKSVTKTGVLGLDIGSFAKAVQTVLFSAYYPKEIVPDKWEPLHAYIFRALASAAVEEDAGKQLGPRMTEFRGVRAPALADVPEGAMVTATPHLDGFQFNPPHATVGFYKDWHRFDFEARAKGAPLNQSTNGMLTFSVEGIIVADVPLSIFVGETVSPASETANAVSKAYQAIFCSYSHDDQHIVARAERAYKALGLDYLRDVMSLKSGQDWSDELLNLINRADIFQLFWSHTAADSGHVRSEWEHALQVAGWKENFIRPVYWEDPKPNIPGELKHLHFAFQPDLEK